MRKILVTGAFGQIGTELVIALQQKYGRDNVIAMDINTPDNFQGIVERFSILEKDRLIECLARHDIGTIYHLVSLLSARGEEDPSTTWDINMEGLRSILDLAVEKKINVFWPSSIAAFGPSTPKNDVPQHTVMEPTTMYGVTKVAGELLCRYYHIKFGLDIRCIRYPGIISWKQEPGGGTTDYAVSIFYEALRSGSYTCFVRPETVLPMVYMDDAIEGTLKLMDADYSKIGGFHAYNMTSLSFSAQQLAEEIKKHTPIEVIYSPDHRQQIADSWPQTIDDSLSRQDWGWSPQYDLPKLTETMLDNLKNKIV